MSELASESMSQRLREAPAERSEVAMSGNVNEATMTILGEAAHG